MSSCFRIPSSSVSQASEWRLKAKHDSTEPEKVGFGISYDNIDVECLGRGVIHKLSLHAFKKESKKVDENEEFIDERWPDMVSDCWISLAVLQSDLKAVGKGQIPWRLDFELTSSHLGLVKRPLVAKTASVFSRESLRQTELVVLPGSHANPSVQAPSTSSLPLALSDSGSPTLTSSFERPLTSSHLSPTNKPFSLLASPKLSRLASAEGRTKRRRPIRKRTTFWRSTIQTMRPMRSTLPTMWLTPMRSSSTRSRFGASPTRPTELF